MCTKLVVLDFRGGGGRRALLPLLVGRSGRGRRVLRPLLDPQHARDPDLGLHVALLQGGGPLEDQVVDKQHAADQCFLHWVFCMVFCVVGVVCVWCLGVSCWLVVALSAVPGSIRGLSSPRRPLLPSLPPSLHLRPTAPPPPLRHHRSHQTANAVLRRQPLGSHHQPPVGLHTSVVLWELLCCCVVAHHDQHERGIARALGLQQQRRRINQRAAQRAAAHSDNVEPGSPFDSPPHL